MQKSKIISGIELGSSKIATVIAQVGSDAVSSDKIINVVGVASVESKGIKKGQIVNIEEAVEASIASIEAAERMAGYNIDQAFVALGGASVSSQNSHGVVAVSNPEGEIGYEDVDRVIEAASAVSLPSSRELIHVLPRDYIVDGESGIKDPVGMSGVRLEVETHLITGSGASVKNLKKAMNEIGVNIVELVYTGFAAGEAVLTSTEKELGCVLIDIGGGTTSVAVYVDGSLSMSMVLPVGAKNVTNDLAIGMRISLESAEKIKIALSQDDKKAKKTKKEDSSDEFNLEELGISEIRKVSRKTLSEGIIRPRLNEIFTMVRLALERENLSTRVPAGAILTGGGSETVGIIDSAKRMLALPVRVGKPNGVTGLIDDIIVPSFATDVGLIIYGAERENVESLTSNIKRFKLPSIGIFGKIVGTIRDLLP